MVIESEVDSITLPYVNIVNINKNTGTISDEDGFFEIDVEQGDTIRFSYIGYQDVKYVADTSTIILVQMLIDIRQLPDQIVRPMPKSLNTLRRAIANLELKDATDTLLGNMEKAGFKKPPAYPTPPPPSIMNPVSLFYEKVVKKIQERSKKKGRMQDAPILE